MSEGILGAIELLGQANTDKTDKQTHVLVCKIIKAMKEKKRYEWPSKELRNHVNKLDSVQRKLFLEVLDDMKLALDEAYGEITI